MKTTPNCVNDVLACLAPTSSGEWANWVQAVGSIFALAVAIFVMSRQNRHAAKLIMDADKLATLRRANSVYAIVKRAESLLVRIRENTDQRQPSGAEGDTWHLHLKTSNEMLDDMIALLRTIPVYDLGSFEMASGVRQLLESCETFQTLVVHLRSEPHLTGTESIRVNGRLIFANVEQAIRTFELGMGWVGRQ